MHNYFNIFLDKIRRMKDIVVSRLIGRNVDPFGYDKPYSGLPFDCWHPVSADEVRKLLFSMPSKSSPMDFVPTSVIKRCSKVFILTSHTLQTCHSLKAFLLHCSNELKSRHF